MVKRKNEIKGFGIEGSGVKGSKDLVFRTRKQAKDFTKQVGGSVVPKIKRGVKGRIVTSVIKPHKKMIKKRKTSKLTFKSVGGFTRF